MAEGKRKLGIEVLRCKKINKKMWRLERIDVEKEKRDWIIVKKVKQQ